MVSSGTELAATSGWVFVLLILAVVTFMKGRMTLFVLGFFLAGLPWIWGAVQIALPHSYWSRRFYGQEKLARAISTHLVRAPRSGVN